MAILSALPMNYSGLVHQGTPYVPSKFPWRVDCCRDVSLTPKMIFGKKLKQRSGNCNQTKFFMSAASNDHHLRFDDDFPQEPFLLTMIKETIWGIKSLFVFLIEQPSQLKYIEWPSFSSTLRTATLALILVALLIVALSSVDSALSYLLAVCLRKSA